MCYTLPNRHNCRYMIVSVCSFSNQDETRAEKFQLMRESTNMYLRRNESKVRDACEQLMLPRWPVDSVADLVKHSYQKISSYRQFQSKIWNVTNKKLFYEHDIQLTIPSDLCQLTILYAIKKLSGLPLAACHFDNIFDHVTGGVYGS